MINPSGGGRSVLAMTKAEQAERRDRVAQLWTEGKPGPEIAREVGMSEMSVYMMVKRLRQQGHPLPNRKPALSERFARIRELERQAA